MQLGKSESKCTLGGLQVQLFSKLLETYRAMISYFNFFLSTSFS